MSSLRSTFEASFGNLKPAADQWPLTKIAGQLYPTPRPRLKVGLLSGRGEQPSLECFCSLPPQHHANDCDGRDGEQASFHTADSVGQPGLWRSHQSVGANSTSRASAKLNTGREQVHRRSLGT